MGIGNINNFKSNIVEYSTPIKLFQPLMDEFNFEIDVCASSENYKCDTYFTKEQDGLKQEWVGNCWMNPPFGKQMLTWVKKIRDESKKHYGTKVCLIPVRSNTKWWKDVVIDAEIRFIIGEVNFNDEPRGLWLPMCLLIFGDKANVGHFSIIDYKELKLQ